MSLKLTRILCATDGTKESDSSVLFASRLAAATSAKLTILAVLPYTLGRGAPIPLWDEAKANAALQSAKDIATQSGVADIHLAQAKAHGIAEAIVSIAAEQHADHIVVGSHGKGAVARVVAGSVSSDVVHKAKCSVTVVH